MISARHLPAVLLLALIAALPVSGAARQAPPPSPAGARSILQEVLATPEFARVAGPTALDRWLEALRRWLADLLRNVGASHNVATNLASAVAWTVAVAAVVALLVLLVRRRTPVVPAAPVASDAEPRRPSSEWIARVAGALDRGDLREAARSAYMAAIMRFDEQGLWRADDTRTPREYAELVPAADPRRRPFRELAAEFERVWYGNRPAEANRLWRWLEDCGCGRR